MASKLVLKNDIATEFKIIHEDGLEAREIKTSDISYTRATVEELTALVGNNGEVCVLTDFNRGGTFVYDSTAVDNGGTVFGKWVRQYDGAVNVKWFGCDPSGNTDDTAKIQAAINTGESVDFIGGTFSAKELVFNKQYTTYTCNGAVLKLAVAGTRLATVATTGIRFRNMVFVGGSQRVAQALVNVDADVKDFEFTNCIFKDINVQVGDDTLSSQYGLYIALQGAEGIVSGCTFKNISHYNYQQTAVSAFNGGIMLHALLAGDRCKISISDCKFDNIWTDNIAGNIDNADSDGIRVYGGNLIATDINISDCSFYGVQKSGIKVSGAIGLNISNIMVRASRTDVPMISAIRLQNSDYTKVDGLVAKGTFSIVMNIRSNNVDVNNVLFYKSGASDPILFQVQADGATDTDNITFRNVQAFEPFRLIHVQNIGTATELPIMSYLTLENVAYKSASNCTHMFTVSNVDYLTLRNIKMNSGFIPSINVLLTDCNNATIDNVDLYAVNQGLSSLSSGATVNGNDLKVLNSLLYRATSAQDRTDRFIVINGYPTNVKLSGLECSTPTFDILGNSELFEIRAHQVSMDNIKLIVRNEGGGTRSPQLINLSACSNVSIRSVDMDVQDTAIQDQIYVASFSNLCEKFLIADINSNSRGLNMGDTNNIAASNIAALVYPFQVDSATNVVSSNIVDWV